LLSIIWALPQGSGFPLYLFKESLRGAGNVAILNKKNSQPKFIGNDFFKKDAAAIPNAKKVWSVKDHKAINKYKRLNN